MKKHKSTSLVASRILPTLCLAILLALLAASCGSSDSDSAMPFGDDISDLTEATDIIAGAGHSCALLQTGIITCWGNNEDGQLGNGQGGDGEFSAAPVQVADITDATAITAGYEHSCALRQGGTISCWGDNWDAQLGNGTNDDSSVPVQVANITDATAIIAGGEHSCALRQGGTVTCWGSNADGQLGNGQRDDSSVPVQVADITDATAITAGYDHSCALHPTGRISCWGNNTSGLLGDGQSDSHSSVPVQIAGITDAVAITTGEEHFCVLRQGGTITCWGNNQLGQLGNG